MDIKLHEIQFDLGDLADPHCFTEPVNLCDAEKDVLISQLRNMLLIRKSEEKIADMVVAGKIVCPCHLAIGQEAVAVGVSRHLRNSDRVFGTHRSHSHFLAMGGDVGGLFAEVLGKASGCSKGMGGSMHLFDKPNGFVGSVPIVAGTIPLAVGAGLAAQLDSKTDSDVGVCYFGDGAVEEGSVHESLNFAARFDIPVLFVCENNLFSSHLHINLRQPATAVSRFAAAHKVNCEIVDGNDIVAVAAAAQRLLEKARNGQGPGFLEAVTYRWRGHVGPSEDIDVGLKRSENLVEWKRRDPIKRLTDALLDASYLTKEQYLEIQEEVNKKIELAWMDAEAAPYPQDRALMDCVYSGGGHD